jgi:hypothetical protein
VGTHAAAAAPGPAADEPPPPAATPETAPAETAPASLPPMPRDLEGIVALLHSGGYPRLAAVLRASARPALVEPGRLRLAWEAGTPPETGREVAAALHALTGRRWGVDSAASEAPTLAERDAAAQRARIAAAEGWPQVRRVLDRVPGATIVAVEVRDADEAPAPPPRQEGSLSG